MTLADLWGQTLFCENLCLPNVDIINKVLKDWAFKHKVYRRKRWVLNIEMTLCYLKWPLHDAKFAPH